MPQDLLFFREGDLRNFFEAVKRTLKSEVESFERDYLLNTDEEELVKYLVEKYTFEAPKLREDEMYVSDPTEPDIDVSQDPMRGIFDRSQPFYIKGVSVTVVIPFDGESRFFIFQPSAFTYNPPRAEISGQEIHLEYTRTEHDPEQLKRDIKSDTGNIKQYLEWVKRDIEQFNATVEPFVREVLRHRKEKAQKDLDLVKSLDIPIKRREDAPKTYAVPKVRKKPKIERPKATKKPFEPEPALPLEEYNNILSIIQNMVFVMERSPNAFAHMREEDLRQHFLVQLNGAYEGEATGETFNYEGKTDILIRHKGKNVFIAECMFWDGPKSLTDKIDQLLGYSSWRDTKTAILVFSRGKNFTGVLEKIPDAVESHPCFKEEIERSDETNFRYTFHHRDDPERELVLTIMAFNIPGE